MTEREVTEKAFILVADLIGGMARASAFARVWGYHAEAFSAAETRVRQLAEQARRGEEIRDNNGLVRIAADNGEAASK